MEEVLNILCLVSRWLRLPLYLSLVIIYDQQSAMWSWNWVDVGLDCVEIWLMFHEIPRLFSQIVYPYLLLMCDKIHDYEICSFTLHCNVQLVVEQCWLVLASKQEITVKTLTILILSCEVLSLKSKSSFKFFLHFFLTICALMDDGSLIRPNPPYGRHPSARQ